jgi:hypothetical protein
MNKTIRTIAIVFLVLGGLAAIAGAVIGITRGRMMTQLPPVSGQQRLPQPRGTWQPMDGRNRGDQRVFVFHRGFLRAPGWLIASGLTFLIAGAVLMIFNRRISLSVEPSKDTVEKEGKKQTAPIKKTAEPRKAAPKKTTKS